MIGGVVTITSKLRTVGGEREAYARFALLLETRAAWST